MSKATGMARSTIGYGLRELRGKAPASTPGGVRRKGAGRKPLTQTDPTLLDDLEKLVDPVTRGDPMSPSKWTSKSLRNLAAGLCAMGHRVTRFGRLDFGIRGHACSNPFETTPRGKTIRPTNSI